MRLYSANLFEHGHQPRMQPDEVETDDEACALLPPAAAARSTYVTRRRSGASPHEALEYTLALWREFQEAGRPVGYERQ